MGARVFHPEIGGVDVLTPVDPGVERVSIRAFRLGLASIPELYYNPTIV